MRVLFVGDVVGRAGRNTVKALLPSIKEQHRVDFIVANCENAAAGFGITRKAADELFAAGVDVLTGGNHIWDKKEALALIEEENRLLRPENFPPGVPGRGHGLWELYAGVKLAVLNLSGRVFMPSLDCPFRAAEAAVKKIRRTTKLIIVDLHAEATSEKIAFGLFMDGKVSAVLGTHTHVQTADEKVLPGGTAYITDVGMTGPEDSVIGVQKEPILERFLLQMPTRFEVAKGPCMLNAVVLDIDEETGRSAGIERLTMRHP